MSEPAPSHPWWSADNLRALAQRMDDLALDRSTPVAVVTNDGGSPALIHRSRDRGQSPEVQVIFNPTEADLAQMTRAAGDVARRILEAEASGPSGPALDAAAAAMLEMSRDAFNRTEAEMTEVLRAFAEEAAPLIRQGRDLDEVARVAWSAAVNGRPGWALPSLTGLAGARVLLTRALPHLQTGT